MSLLVTMVFFLVYMLYIDAMDICSLNRSTVGQTLNGSFREVVGLWGYNLVTMALHGSSLGPK